MRWLYHRAMFGVLALVVLAVGSVAVTALMYWIHPRHSPPIGYYGGSFSGQLFGISTNLDIIVSLRLRAKTDSRWQWSDADGFRYTAVTVEGLPPNDFVVSLPEMTSWSGGIKRHLNEKELAIRIQEMNQTSDQVPAEIPQFILSTIKAAGDGTFRRTHHHPFTIDQAGLRLIAFNSKVGVGIPTWLLPWWAGWLVLVIFGYRRLLRREKTQP